MKLKKAKLWRVLWRQKSLTENLADYDATSYDDVDQGSRLSSRSSDSRSTSSDASFSSVPESTSMSNNDTNSNGDVYVSRGKLTKEASFDVGLLRKKQRSDTESSTGSGGKSSRPKSLPVESLPSSKSHSKHKHLSDSNDDHTPSRHSSSSRLSSDDETPKTQLRHTSRVHSIPEMPESNLTKSCEVPPVTSKTKKDMKKSHSIASMSTMLETPTSSKSRDYDVIPATRRISTSSYESDDIFKRSSSKGSKISNNEEIHDDHNNNHEHKSKKSKKKDKDKDREREKEKDREKEKLRDSLAPTRPKTLDLNITTPESDETKVEEEEEDIGVVTCSGHEHKKEHIYLDEVYHFNVDQLFELLFTDSEFYRNFLNARKTFDLIQAPWPEDPDENGEKKREIGYTLSLNYSIGPKVSQSSEKQTILGQSKPGHKYVVETDCTQGGIPYGDNFYVQNRYCITRVSSTRTKLVTQSEIKYKKNVWGLVKNFIEKNVHEGTKQYFKHVDLIEKNGKQGMRDNFKLLGDMLRAEAEKSSPQGAAAGRKKMLRKRRPHASVPDRSPSLKRSAEQRGHAAGSLQGQSAKGSFSEDDWHIKVTTDSLVYFVCAILLVLVLFNVLLFYKLWSLESKASSLHQFAQHRHTEHRHTDPIYAHPASPLHHHHSPDEWNHVIEQQRRLHELELERWKDVLTASVSLVDQMKITLQELLANIEHRTQLLAEMMQQQKEASKH